jgi:hypothetical protein
MNNCWLLLLIILIYVDKIRERLSNLSSNLSKIRTATFVHSFNRHSCRTYWQMYVVITFTGNYEQLLIIIINYIKFTDKIGERLSNLYSNWSKIWKSAACDRKQKVIFSIYTEQITLTVCVAVQVTNNSRYYPALAHCRFIINTLRKLS